MVTPFTPHDADGNPVVPAAVVKEFMTDYYALQLGPEWVQESQEPGPQHAVARDAKSHFDAMQKSLDDRVDGNVQLVEVQLRDYVTQRNAQRHHQRASDAPKRVVQVPDGHAHVVVVGAGAAGLACAQRLIQGAARANASDKLHVSVVEGRSRIGGRVHTSRSHDVVVDLGAMWFHGLVDNLAYELQPDENWKLFQTEDISSTMFLGPRPNTAPTSTLGCLLDRNCHCCRGLFCRTAT